MPQPIHEQRETPRRIRVLVIDDSEDVRIGLQRLFAAHALIQIVGVATDGQAGIAAAETLRPDVVVAGFQMPGMSGLEVTRSLVARFPSMRVVMMSIHDEEVVRSACMESGAHGFVSKFRLHSELSREIERVLDTPL